MERIGVRCTVSQAGRPGMSSSSVSSDDAVRVFQRFSTLDAVSGGRAEVIVGRGSFIESFPLFGYRLEDYDVPFEEKPELVRCPDPPAVGHLGRPYPGPARRPAGLPPPRSRQRCAPGWASAAAPSRWCGRPATGSR